MNKIIPQFVFFIPVLTVIISYFISFFGGFVDWCMPLLDGCTSISKVGRYGISFYLYKLFIIPSLILTIIFWYQINLYIHKSNFLFSLATVSSVFLIVYLIALGFDGNIYRFMREIGIFVFFILTPVCQVWLTISISSEKIKAKNILYILIFLYLVCVVSYLFILPLDNANYENIIEWNFALLIFLFFPVFRYLLVKANA